VTKQHALLEICVDSLTSAKAAENGGAHRLEVCAELTVGGLTPSVGLLSEIRECIDLPLHVLIRPRSGNFLYSEEELNVMERDIAWAQNAGAQGVVLGALGAQREIDREQTARLAEAAHPLDVTFHRAFDFTPEPMQALDTLISLGVGRLLTSGGCPSVPEGLQALAQMIATANEQLIVMPGGGIRSGDVARILNSTGARELHASARTLKAARKTSHDSGARLDSADFESGPHGIADENEVRKIITAIHSRCD
jgi:copper homeostasis protein